MTNTFTGGNLLLAGDFNGDGMQDMACIGSSQTQTNVYIALSTGGGAFTQPQASWSASGSCIQASTILTGDFDGDGRTDLVCIGTTGNETLSVVFSQGNGTFAAAPTPLWPVGGGGWCSNPSIHVGDFNGDGKSDLICVNAAAGQYQVAFSNGDGSFTTGPTFPSTGTWCKGGTVQIADINGDGKADLVCTDATNHQTVAFSKGDGTFSIAAAWPSGSGWCATTNGSAPSQLSFADLNGDGKADMVCQSATVGPTGTNITVAYSNGDGTFSTPGGTTSWCATNFLTSGDVNGDGATDLVCFGGTITATALAVGTPDLVTGYSNGLTASGVPAVTATYLPITKAAVFTKATGDSYPIQDSMGPYYVVSSVSRANGIGGFLTTNYTYAGLRSDMTGRGSLGFGMVTSTEAQTSIVSSTVYNQTFPFIGLPWTATTSLSGQGNAGVLKTVVSNYQCINPATGSACTTAVGNRYFPALQYSTVTPYDLNGAALPTTTTTTTYDTTYTFFGNVKSASTSTSDGYSKTTTNTYNAPDLTHWWLGQVNETQVSNTTP